MQWRQIWFAFAEKWDWIYTIRVFGQIVIILVGFHIFTRVVSSIIDRSFSVTEHRFDRDEEKRRMETIRRLLKSAVRYIIDFAALLTILPILNVPIAQILAGAGVLGLAVGFGTQHIVRDIISGFFVLFENQFTVGDFVEVAGVSGVIEEMGLKTTRVRDFGGQVHFIPNGRIEHVTNYSRGDLRVLVDIDVAYEEDVAQVVDVLDELCEEMAGDIEELTAPPEVLGVQELGDSSVTLRIRARAASMQQWNVEREIRHRIKKRLDDRDIEIPYPRRVVVPSMYTKISSDEQEE